MALWVAFLMRVNGGRGNYQLVPRSAWNAGQGAPRPRDAERPWWHSNGDRWNERGVGRETARKENNKNEGSEATIEERLVFRLFRAI